MTQTEQSLLGEIAKYETDAPLDNVASLELAAHNIHIETRDDYARCAELLNEVKRGISAHESHWEPLRAAAYALYQAVMDKLNEKSLPANAAKAILQTKMSDFRLAQEKLVAERREQAAAAHQEALQSASREAKDLILSGKPQEGFAVLQKARLLVPAVECVNLRLEGTSQIPDFDVIITDTKAVLQEIIDGNLPIETTMRRKKVPVATINLTAVKEIAKGLGTAFAVKGIELKNRISYRTRGR